VESDSEQLTLVYVSSIVRVSDVGDTRAFKC
jgi:hypothetical protein